MGKLKRILIVDNDDHVRDLMYRVLKRVGETYDVLTTGNGRQALEMFKRRAFDLVIVDLRMPAMDGLKLTQKIKALAPETFVIWVTAFGCYRVREEAEVLSVCDCLNKPIEIGEIRRVVCEALGTPHSTGALSRDTRGGG